MSSAKNPFGQIKLAAIRLLCSVAKSISKLYSTKSIVIESKVL